MRPDSPLRHAKHVVRAFLLLVLGVVALVVVRSLMVPDTWGEAGWYRLANVAEQRAREPRHAGDAACAACHDDVVAARAAGGHAAVSCELCHAPLDTHVVEGDIVAEMAVRKEAALCLGCHRFLPARPSSFPQVDARDHVEEQGGDYGPRVCFDCHDPHAPL